MSSKYILNQFGKLSKKEYAYATKKINKYTKNFKINPSIKNSIITPNLSRKKQIKYIIKNNLLHNNHNLGSTIKTMTKKKRKLTVSKMIPFLKSWTIPV